MQVFKKTEFGHTFDAEAYEKDGIWYWCSNNNPVPMDAAEDYQIPIDKQKQEEALSKHYDAVLTRYRQNYTGPSLEEQFEMRAAFGPGTEVVDVITGHKWKT